VVRIPPRAGTYDRFSIAFAEMNLFAVQLRVPEECVARAATFGFDWCGGPPGEEMECRNVAQHASGTFLGLEACDLSRIEVGTHAVIFGACEGTPHKRNEPSHAADAPDALRRALKAAGSDVTRWDFDQEGPLLPTDLRVRDAGNLATDATTPERNRELIRCAARAVLEASAVPVLLGGDDSVPIPFFEAFENRGPITIIQVDAHLDWRDERNGERHTFSSPMRRASEMPWVERIVQVGLRGIGGSRENDLEDARRWGSQLFTAAHIRRHGMSQVFDCFPNGARCVVTIDCDGLDPSVIPAVIVPQPGGLSYPDVVELFDGISAKGRIEGVDVVELVPARDVHGIGAFTAARIVCKAIGCIAHQRRGQLP
jgi:agmatinase